jgi:hypothetical protein
MQFSVWYNIDNEKEVMIKITLTGDNITLDGGAINGTA